jgi:hypothetical protein
MKPKMKTITLVAGFAMKDDTKETTGYRVVKVTDSLDYKPATLIRKSEVQELCDAPDWKVTILPINPN